jgi:hypothetical protein
VGVEEGEAPDARRVTVRILPSSRATEVYLEDESRIRGLAPVNAEQRSGSEAIL